MDNLVIDLRRTDRRVHFECISASHPSLSIPLDYVPPLGADAGFAGLELLLVSFCGCVSTAIVALLLRMGRQIGSYSVHAEGVRAEQPLSLKQILFHVEIDSADTTDADMQTVLRQAEQISPVWLALRNNVSVETSYQVL